MNDFNNQQQIKTISDLIQFQPGNITCPHCDYFFRPQNQDRFTCPDCNKTYIICHRCRKMIGNDNNGITINTDTAKITDK